MPRKRKKSSIGQRKKHFQSNKQKRNIQNDADNEDSDCLQSFNTAEIIAKDEFNPILGVCTSDVVFNNSDPESYGEIEDCDGDKANAFYVILDKVYQYDPSCDLDLFVNDKNARQFQILKHEVSKTMFDTFSYVQGSNKIQLVKFYQSDKPSVQLCVTISDNFKADLYIHNNSVSYSHDFWLGLPSVFNRVSDIKKLESKLSSWHVCSGNEDEEFQDMIVIGGAISDAKSASNFQAYREGNFGAAYKSTIRSVKCDLLCMYGRCGQCARYRGTLRKSRSRKNRQEQESFSESRFKISRTPNSKLSRSDLISKVNHLKAENVSLQNKIRTLKKRLEKEVATGGESLSAWDNEEMSTLVSQTTGEFEKAFPDPNSVQRLFWEQQIKYNSYQNKCSMKWHPMIIRLCLLLRSKSNKAYETLRDSGFISLPRSRTLFDYSHYTTSKLGFQPDVMEMLIAEVEKKKMHEKPWKNFVGLLQDEVKVKSDLVYDKNSGELVGFINLDNIGNEFSKLEQTFEAKSTCNQLAKFLLVLMVRGIAVDLAFPFAAFATSGITADGLYPIIWQGISLLETHARLKVLFVTCDGASQNRKFFDIHRVNDDDYVTFCTTNIASGEDRNIFFISDVPHLIKTARNCLSNSHSHKKTRRLWNAGRDISWLHIVKLYEEHCEMNLWSVCPKLTRNHIDLTAFSCMKVNLAAQVLSSSVSHALEYHYPNDESVNETAKFLRLMDNFFDCLNVRNLLEGKTSRKPFREPFNDVNDFRFQWLKEDFLGYFEEWKRTVLAQYGNLPKSEQSKMMLSHQTLKGFCISVNAITESMKCLLNAGMPFVLTHVFNQDPLEQHFGHYRHKGGSNDNPTIFEVSHTLTQLRAVGAQALAPRNGNIKRQNIAINQIDNTPLKKRK